MGVAFFDLDKTLLSKNSGSLWLRHEVRQGRVSAWQAARAAAWLVRYSLGFVNLEPGLRIAIEYLSGVQEDELRRRVHAWYDREVRALYRPGGHAALERHRAQGHRLVLLTSASNYVSERVLDELGLDDFLCNRFEVDEDGRYTGRSRGELCYGAGKLTYAERYATEAGLTLADCTFYTDSMADLPVLEAVGYPVCVNPDPRLKRLAMARGWPVEDWGAR